MNISDKPMNIHETSMNIKKNNGKEIQIKDNLSKTMKIYERAVSIKENQR